MTSVRVMTPPPPTMLSNLTPGASVESVLTYFREGIVEGGFTDAYDALERYTRDDERRDTLMNFVPWLTARYAAADTVPECWAKHPAVVDEMIDLFAQWFTCQPGFPALVDAALDRVKRRWVGQGCVTGTHQDHLEPTWVEKATETQGREILQIVTDDHHDEGEGQ